MYTIRPARVSDLERITEIESICFPPEQAAGKDAFLARLNAFPDHFLLIESEGVCCGFINGAVIETRYIADEMYADIACHKQLGRYQSVFGLDVLPDHRGRGLAHRLMTAMVELAGSEKRLGVTLTCLREKIGFYESMGFHCEGIAESCHGGALWYNMVLDF